MSASERANPSLIPSDARVYRMDNLQSQSMGREKGEGASCWFPVKINGQEFLPGARSRWKTNERGMLALRAANRLEATATGLYYVRFIDDFPAMPIGDNWTDTVVAGFASDKKYVVETSVKVVERCLMMTTDPGDLVLDPTCGSGTTAYVAEQWGRRWITTDTSRVALALARTRLMTARFPYYLLSDSPEGVKKEAEMTGKMPPPYKTDGDIRKGFVYQRIPHVTLKSIASNPDIKEGMTPKQFNEAIARHAETETLYDKSYEDRSRLRVTGPFTVESLSPHRTISVEEKKARSQVGKDGWKVKLVGPTDFSHMILENLKKAGVQNTVKKERLNFDSVEPYPGEWLHGEGRFAEADGKIRRAAICVGPEYGTVGPELVKEAAKEAVRGVGFDLLIVCGFSFDPHVSEEAKRYGKLTVLTVRMNPDLSMGDDLLKKTGAGNLFMVFGEPDLTVEKTKDGKFVVEINGVDVYDPTTGEIRSNTTDDIACWFIDTNYNGESFFVRHAYFTGADQPYEKLKNALRAEIDEGAWSQLYTTTSRPFDKPSSGKIAVKVINHYGDEVLKVYPIPK
jgi:adenine-specific DNA-methyltransferase